jgi:hypothetical protein
LPHQDYASKDFYQLCKAGKLNSIISTLSLGTHPLTQEFWAFGCSKFLGGGEGKFY